MVKLKPRRRRLVACTVVVVATGLCTPLVAAASDAPLAGWWSSDPTLTLEPGNTSPGDLIVEGSTASAEGASDSKATAFAAVSFPIPAGSVVSTLTLSLAAGAVSTPDTTLQVCPLKNPIFQPANGGAIGGAPAYSCELASTASDPIGATSFKFSVMSMVKGGYLGVAVLPTKATDRVVLASPTSSSAPVMTSAPPSDLGSTSTLPQSESVGSAVTPNAEPSGSSDIPAAVADLPAEAATSEQQPIAAPSDPAGSSSAPPLVARTPTLDPTSAASVATGSASLTSDPTPNSGGVNGLAVGGLIVGVALAGGLWVTAGRSRRYTPDPDTLGGPQSTIDAELGS